MNYTPFQKSTRSFEIAVRKLSLQTQDRIFAAPDKIVGSDINLWIVVAFIDIALLVSICIGRKFIIISA